MKYYNFEEREKIIGLVKQIQNIVGPNLGIIDYEFGNKFSASSNHDSSHHIVQLYQNKEITKLYKREVMEDPNFGLYGYFNNMKITSDLHYCAFYIQCILHELGHIEQRKLFKYCIDLIDISNTTRTMLNRSNNTLNAMNRRQNSYNELYAEKFAYKWFPIIWNEFKDQIIETLL